MAQWLQRDRKRRAVILLVVLLMLSLFAAVGLAFVLYAESAAASARLYRESVDLSQPDVDPELLLAYFLGEMIYDAPDDEVGVYSALRGHSLARNLYGGNSPSPSATAVQPAANLTPFAGLGRMHWPSPFGSLIPDQDVSDYHLVNYTFYRDDGQVQPNQRFLRDPERFGWRSADVGAPRGAYVGGWNVPWTYPDLNAAFLAAVKADGTVLLPSFHRPWTAAVPGSPFTAADGDFYDRNSGKLNPLWSSNPSNLPAWYKYTTLRPLPALNPGFPPPEDGGGDVKNLAAGPGTLRRLNGTTAEYWGNDSFWIDLDFPVLLAPDGRKYKPLFAPLIVDLDGRINVNVHGNVQGKAQIHASNQGWGPWEVSLEQILSQDGEWRNLLSGSAKPYKHGRYGDPPGNAAPGRAGARAAAGRPIHVYSQVDFDGYNERTSTPTSRPLLPGLGAGARNPFPEFITSAGSYGGYGNRSNAERRGHPSLYNFFSPTADDRAYALSNMEALLRYGDTGSPALTSDLFALCPKAFASGNARGMVTTHSFDLDRPGVSPWVHDPASYPYLAEPTLDPDQPTAPQGPPIPPPTLTASGGEFGWLDGRALSAALGRVDLSRPLPPYPHQGSGKARPFGPPLTRRNGKVVLDIPFNIDAPSGPIWKQFLLAQSARQQLANDIYRRLLAAVGVSPILSDQNPQAPPLELLRARRWLAQLAANIVDYIDEDEISTPFCFYTAEDYQHLSVPPNQPPDPDRVSRADASLLPGRPAGELQWPVYWVFGTELPRVVVNEALAETGRVDLDNAYADSVRVFVELHNPLPRSVPTGVYRPDSWPVPLRMGEGEFAYAPYRLVVGIKSAVPFRTSGAAILPGAENDNVLGNPEPTTVRTASDDTDVANAIALPAYGASADGQPQGFALLGPPRSSDLFFAAFDPFASGIPDDMPVVRSPNFEYRAFFNVRQPGDPPDERSEGVAVLLRRLANPFLPFQPSRVEDGSPNVAYNPFVTVDYVEDVPLGPVADAAGQPLASVGKLQPYAAHRSQLRPQTTQAVPGLNCTFGRDNSPAPEHYDWLTHLDRRPTSPLELLCVSGYQPYQLTQRFITPGADGQAKKFGHLAAWHDEGQPLGGPSHRLYRLFEFLTCGNDAAGVAAGGRIPGKVNLNTVWDPEIFRALCDAQPANSFATADVNDVFKRMIYAPDTTGEKFRRTPNAVPGPADRPFKGYAAGTYPPGTERIDLAGVEDSAFRMLPLLSDRPHPTIAAEMLTKIAGQVTTRSSVFAVWVTVGFFEVTDDTTRPVKLGSELGRAENRHVRHRMFAIVDRSSLSVASCVASLQEAVRAAVDEPQTIPVSSLSGPAPGMSGNGATWTIAPSMWLVVDAGAEQETVEVESVRAGKAPTVTARFTKAHAAGAAISLANWPGAPPWFVKPIAVEGPDPLSGPPWMPRLPYTITIRVAADSARSSDDHLEGSYEGIRWDIRPETKLILDVGSSQEVVAVESDSFTFDRAAGVGSFRVVVTKPHAGSFPITNTFLGNPGPQRRFDPRDPAFAAVIRFLSVIQ